MASSCVPASHFESPLGPFGPEEMREILRHPRALGVAEMMNFPGVIAGDEDVLARMVAPHVDGHAPGVLGRALDAYVAAGIVTDHEAFTAAEALEKRRRGMWVLIREASNARNLLALLDMVREHGPDYCAFCTDDREPDYLHRDGHIDEMCRRAVDAGIAAEDVLVMASLHGARAHRLLDRGAIAPGYVADLVLLDDLESFSVARVLKDGREPVYPARVAAALRDTMRSVPVSFGIAGYAGARAGDRRQPGSADHRRGLRGAEARGRARGRRPRPRPGQDRRDRAPSRDRAGRSGDRARVRAAGRRVLLDRRPRRAQPRRRRACPTPTWRCAPRGRRSSGAGSSSPATGRCVGELALPIAGLLSDRPLEEVAEGLERLQDLLVEQGVEIGAPFMTLSFLALSVIPSLKITDRGLVDVDAFELVAARAATAATPSWRASARCTSTRRGSPSGRGGRRASTTSRSSTARCARRCTPRRATSSWR